MEIGIIGTGDMGKLYAREFASAGFDVYCCDLPENREEIEGALGGTNRIHVLDNGTAISRSCDLIFYLVETKRIGDAARMYGPSTRRGAIVCSGTSVMTPAAEAFERYMPKDVDIIHWHWLFGPSVKPQGQTSVMATQRVNGSNYWSTREDVLEKLGISIIDLPYDEHDKITADTQAVTHVGFEAMGTAWKNVGSYPWENPIYVGGIDNVKILMCLRIFNGKHHVYSELAILNPYARKQVRQYATSESELFIMMIQEDADNFRDRIRCAGEFVFGNSDSPILLDDGVMGEFALGAPPGTRKPNSHLSLLAMVDAWHQLGINPYKHMICQTPPFRLRLGIAEYLFRNRALLEESLETALFDKGIRSDDLEFHTAVSEWATIIENGDHSGYKSRFEATRDFFPPEKLAEGMKRSTELIKRLTKK